MQAMQVVEYARQLVEARGDQAEAEAARRIRSAEEEGSAAEAETWRRIRSAIHELRPPHVS